MVKIRLTRLGKRNTPFFRLVITPLREKRESKAIEIVGHYSPLNKEIVLKEDRIKYWLSVGAQPSDAVRNMLVRKGVMEPSAKKRVYAKKAGKQAADRAEAAAAPKAE